MAWLCISTFSTLSLCFCPSLAQVECMELEASQEESWASEVFAWVS